MIQFLFFFNFPASESTSSIHRLLIWNNSDTFIDLENQIDTVICADCLFFTELHGDLLHTMTTILKPEVSIMGY